jgi:YD repeat-containing protein
MQPFSNSGAAPATSRPRYLRRTERRGAQLPRLLTIVLALLCGPFISGRPGHLANVSAGGGGIGGGGGTSCPTPVTFVYDPAGQLIAAVDPSGYAATYTYDAVGNLLSIGNTTCASASIFGFNPNNGPVGMQLTIWGDGFSATPSQNTVTFSGGATASVISSSLTSIAVTVPSGAQNGPITVTAPTGTVTSTATFKVD